VADAVFCAQKEPDDKVRAAPQCTDFKTNKPLGHTVQVSGDDWPI
jgi:hypothetical protein